MVISAHRNDVPDWVQDNWMKVCPHCNCFIVDNSDRGPTTARYCSNPSCPGHMSMKVGDLTEFLGIKGIGPKTAESIIKKQKYKSHLDFLKLWCEDKKPLVYLSKIAMLACIDGLGETKAISELSSYASFEQYFSQCPNPDPILMEHSGELIEAQQYFEIKPPLSKMELHVMGTSPYQGFSSREQYFNILNDMFGKFVHIVQVGKRKTNVDYLICERDASSSAKIGIALDYNIPRVTPAQFLTMLYGAYPGVITPEQYHELLEQALHGTSLWEDLS